MNRILASGFIFFILIAIMSCDDNTTGSELSIEDEINMGSPYRNITVSFRGESPPARFGTGTGVTNFEEAHAEDGYLIIRLESENNRKIFYNLDTVIDVSIDPGSQLMLTY